MVQGLRQGRDFSSVTMRLLTRRSHFIHSWCRAPNSSYNLHYLQLLPASSLQRTLYHEIRKEHCTSTLQIWGVLSKIAHMRIIFARHICILLQASLCWMFAGYDRCSNKRDDLTPALRTLTSREHSQGFLLEVSSNSQSLTREKSFKLYDSESEPVETRIYGVVILAFDKIRNRKVKCVSGIAKGKLRTFCNRLHIFIPLNANTINL